MRLTPIASVALLGLLAFSCAQGSTLDAESDGKTGGQGGGPAGGTGSGAGSGAASGGVTTSGSMASGSGAGGAMAGSSGVGVGGAAASSAMGAGGAVGAGGAMGAGGAVGPGAGGGGGALGCVAFSEPFANCPGGFTSSGPNNDWQCGMPSGAAGPPSDHTGNGSLWGTNIAGNANTCEDSELVSPVMDLSAFAGKTVLLSFWHWFDFRGCTPGGVCPAFACMLDKTSYSGGVVEVFSNGSWVQVNPIGGYGNGGQTISCAHMDAACTSCGLDGKTGFTSDGMEGVWQEAVIDVSAYVGAMSKIRFRYASHDAYACYPKKGGWYIDDIAVTTPDLCP
jgi:hypothetical protein